MSPLAIGCIVLACVFGGALLGMALRRIVPEHHLSADSKDVIKLGMALTATMSALVLALLISSANASYDAQRNEVIQLSANIMLLDRLLAHYGPETKGAREQVRLSAAGLSDRIWNGAGKAESKATSSVGEAFFDKIQELSPQNEVQRSLQAQALQVGLDIAHARLLLFEQGGRSIPMPFLVLLTFWVTIIFLSFGLFAPPNATVITILFLCALSVSGAIFMILELDAPFSGLIQISSLPLRSAVAQLGK